MCTFLFQSLGNHEFDNGVSGLTPFIENLTCPVLAANLVLNKVPELAREENLKKSIVLNVGNNKIGIIGYLTPDTKTIAVKNDVEYIDEIEALNKEVKKLQEQGINIIIALGHSGYSRDLQIAKEVEGLDLIIGGHTNTFLWNGSSPDSEHSEGPYPTYVTQASGRRRVPVVHAYAYTKYLGKLNLIFDTNGELINVEGTPLLLDYRIPQDPHILNIIEKYRKNILATTEEIVGNTSVILDAKTCPTDECNLGNLITDAVIFHYAVNYKGEHWTDAPIAIIQGGGIRSSVAHGTMPMQITKGDILAVLPFEGDLVAVTMNGSILIKMFEHSVSKYNTLDMHGQLLQISGIKIKYDIKKPAGSRVVSIEARCWACNVPVYSKVEDKQIYKVLMSAFLYNGGDGYWMLKNLPKQDLNYNELLSTEYYVLRHSPIYSQVEGRITFVDQDYQSGSSSIIKLSLSIAIISIINLLMF